MIHQLVYQYRQQRKLLLVSGHTLYQSPLPISAHQQLQLDHVKLVIIVLLEVRGLSIVLIIVVLVNSAQKAQQISILQLVLLAIINQIRFSQLATYV